jgi:hypothetical protein
MRKAVGNDGVESGVTKNDFQPRPRGWVARHHSGNFFL